MTGVSPGPDAYHPPVSLLLFTPPEHSSCGTDTSKYFTTLSPYSTYFLCPTQLLDQSERGPCCQWWTDEYASPRFSFHVSGDGWLAYKGGWWGDSNTASTPAGKMVCRPLVMASIFRATHSLVGKNKSKMIYRLYFKSLPTA